MIHNIDLYDAGQVTRYHSNPQMNRLRQTNADHQWGVIAILFSIFGDGVTKGLLLHAAFHDVAERKVGDLSATFKDVDEFANVVDMHRAVEQIVLEGMTGGQLPALSSWEENALKAADRIEAVLYILCYHHSPHLVEGWKAAVNKISMACAMDPTGKIYQFCDLVINPMLADNPNLRQYTITPF